ncbi:unnamed protein product [marine sediment metagenome]|uniref:Uncharacterized protein n=1 Tax=marine sediment metagenome TaxID=412755 RepID=X1UGA6_9ZZZZ
MNVRKKKEKGRTVYDQEQKAEDVERIKNSLNRRRKKDKNKSPYLKPDNG